MAHPRASTAGNFLMTAFFFAILMTPRARVTVTQIGRPSGIAATARDTPKKSEKETKRQRNRKREKQKERERERQREREKEREIERER